MWWICWTGSVNQIKRRPKTKKQDWIGGWAKGVLSLIKYCISPCVHSRSLMHILVMRLRSSTALQHTVMGLSTVLLGDLRHQHNEDQHGETMRDYCALLWPLYCSDMPSECPAGQCNLLRAVGSHTAGSAALGSLLRMAMLSFEYQVSTTNWLDCLHDMQISCYALAVWSTARPILPSGWVTVFASCSGTRPIGVCKKHSVKKRFN